MSATQTERRPWVETWAPGSIAVFTDGWRCRCGDVAEALPGGPVWLFEIDSLQVTCRNGHTIRIRLEEMPPQEVKP